MLNKHYRMMVGQAVGSTSVVSMGDSEYVPYDGTNSIALNSSCWNTVKDPQGYGDSTNFVSLIVGSGTTEATENDTKLENIISNLTYLTGSTSNGTTDYVKLVTVTYRNNTTDVLNINEVGLMAGMRYTTNAKKCILLGRVVLETPVVMNPGDIYTFSYVIE